MLVGMTAHFLSTVLFKVIIINTRDKGLPSQSKKHLEQEAGLHHFPGHCDPGSPVQICEGTAE